MILNSSDVAAIHPSSLSFADVLMDPLIAAGILLTGIGIGLGSSGVSKSKEVAPVTCHCECSGQSPSSPDPTGYSLRELTFVGVIGLLLDLALSYLWDFITGITLLALLDPLIFQKGEVKEKRESLELPVPLRSLTNERRRSCICQLWRGPHVHPHQAFGSPHSG